MGWQMVATTVSADVWLMHVDDGGCCARGPACVYVSQRHYEYNEEVLIYTDKINWQHMLYAAHGRRRSGGAADTLLTLLLLPSSFLRFTH